MSLTSYECLMYVQFPSCIQEEGTWWNTSRIKQTLQHLIEAWWYTTYELKFIAQFWKLFWYGQFVLMRNLCITRDLAVILRSIRCPKFRKNSTIIYKDTIWRFIRIPFVGYGYEREKLRIDSCWFVLLRNIYQKIQ